MIIKILAENGETRTLTLLKLANTDNNSVKVEEPMVFEHKINNEYKMFRLMIMTSELIIDWGDGSITESTGHGYRNIGCYRVKVYNYSDEKIGFHLGPGWADGIYNFISIGRIGIENFTHMFSHTNFDGIIGPNWDTSQVTNISYMFFNCAYFNKQFGQNWDTKNLIDIRYMFCMAHKFNQPLGKNWDTSNVRHMDGMFLGAGSFNQPFDFSGGKYWDTRNLRSMSYMFSGAIAFNQPFGQNWNIQNVITMEHVFKGASNFKQEYRNDWDLKYSKGTGL